MIKSILSLLVVCFLLVSSASFAGPILCETDVAPDPTPCLDAGNVSSEFYITKGNFDWVWASFVNTQFTFGINELKLPTFAGRNWKFAESVAELEALMQLTLPDFTRADNSIIEATKYWNTKIHGVNTDNLSNKEISSSWVAGDHDFFYYDTFYVRASTASLPINVPEPTTLFIFAAGLLGFTMRKRMKK